MTEFLVNKFIKDSANIESTEVRTRYGMLASVVGIFVMSCFFCEACHWSYFKFSCCYSRCFQ